jgi:hypothetical protein
MPVNISTLVLTAAGSVYANRARNDSRLDWSYGSRYQSGIATELAHIDDIQIETLVGCCQPASGTCRSLPMM